MAFNTVIDTCEDEYGEEITQFEGETAWDTLISHHGLDFEEEDDFLSFLEAALTSPGRCDLTTLQAHYLEWRRLESDCNCRCC